MPEPKNAILEESETTKGHRIATVTDNRGGEFVVNVDTSVIALVQFFSDLDNEIRGGWTLNAGCYEGELGKLRAATAA